MKTRFKVKTKSRSTREAERKQMMNDLTNILAKVENHAPKERKSNKFSQGFEEEKDHDQSEPF
jgi:uncharacterized protein YhaN